jgi:hypothetical protein
MILCERVFGRNIILKEIGALKCVILCGRVSRGNNIF